MEFFFGLGRLLLEAILTEAQPGIRVFSRSSDKREGLFSKSPMGTLYLVRHGQASFGADDYDVLSPAGHEQAVRLGEYWRGRHGV